MFDYKVQFYVTSRELEIFLGPRIVGRMTFDYLQVPPTKPTVFRATYQDPWYLELTLYKMASF